MIAAYLLELTRITPEQEQQSTRRANPPPADIRSISITQSCSTWYIGREDEGSKSASDNAYFASEAVEHNHALVTLNNKVLQTPDHFFVEGLT